MSSDLAPAPKTKSKFAERYSVAIKEPLPEFNTPGGEAYAVSDSANPDAAIYALVHYPSVPVREDLYKALKEKPIANLVCPKDRGLMTLGLKGGDQQRLVTIFERPLGGPLMTEQGAVNEGVNPLHLRQNIILCTLKAIAGLHKIDHTHRSIRPTAMYFLKADRSDITIGECCSYPIGYKHHYALDALENCFTDERSKPKGDKSSDFFQFGAALLCLNVRAAAWQGRDGESFITARINQGSYWALGGGQEIPGATGNLVKGLMADDLSERWDAQDVLDWFEGAVKPKRTSMKAWSMNRPTRFNGKSYIDRRLLADAFANEPEAALKFLRDMNFATWIQMSFRDEVLSERAEKQLGINPSEGMASSRNHDHETIARICMFLYPQGPIRYKGLAVSVDNLGGILADAFAKDDRQMLTVLSEILAPRFLNSLMETLGGKAPEFNQHVAMLRKVGDIAKSTQLAQGMERVLYELNPSMPCLSNRFEKNWIVSVDQAVKALDRLASSGNVANVLTDRHIAAFMSKHGSGLEQEFNKLSSAQGNSARFNTLSLDFFGALQKRFRIGPLPSLTDKLVSGLMPAIKGMKNQKNKERLKSLLEKLKKGGDLSKISSDINISKMLADDARAFANARGLLAKLEKDRFRLSGRISAKDPEALEKGVKGARTLAFIIFTLTIVLVTMQ
ncbi:hypothetical protein [Kordiimonas sp. SCSIO 12610]|uniref:hypothetical protein n=1 Tax=Kordiimonas sp. SCSIO 12610 TaxID=2829597 RepID=UPI00210D6361|nr:hypothetical protein [Kordiimonas sp. SCSIO 12610]UTW56463.1 hypothetical protein KFF44_06055 [Kordiimonas sp. SCSIO 12610]